jgi:hypothetical protein
VRTSGLTSKRRPKPRTPQFLFDPALLKTLTIMTKTATLLAILFISSLQFAFINAVVEQTATFQHGVNGWWGGASVDISEGPQDPEPLGS